MEAKELIGTIIMAICCFACGVLFYFIGHRAKNAEKPVNFWAGKQVDSSRVTDIPAYNCANAVMWKVYSVPYFLAGILSCFAYYGDGFNLAALCFLVLACVPGLVLLIRHYKQIEKQYIIR